MSDPLDFSREINARYYLARAKRRSSVGILLRCFVLIVGVGVAFTAVCFLVGVSSRSPMQLQDRDAVEQYSTKTKDFSRWPLKTIQAKFSRDPFIVRGECELSTYYNFDFSGALETHYSVSLHQPDSGASLHFYVERESANGKKIFKLLAAGRRELTVECAFGNRDPSIASLLRIIE